MQVRKVKDENGSLKSEIGNVKDQNNNNNNNNAATTQSEKCKMTNLENQVKDLKAKQSTTRGAVLELEERVSKVEPQVTGHESRLATMGSKLDSQVPFIHGHLAHIRAAQPIFLAPFVWTAAD